MKYDPVKRNSRVPALLAGMLAKDLAHAEAVIAWQAGEIERLKALINLSKSTGARFIDKEQSCSKSQQK